MRALLSRLESGKELKDKEAVGEVVSPDGVSLESGKELKERFLSP